MNALIEDEDRSKIIWLSFKPFRGSMHGLENDYIGLDRIHEACKALEYFVPSFGRNYIAAVEAALKQS